MNAYPEGTPPELEAQAKQKGKPEIALIIYILYLAGLLTGITPIIGVVMAYVYQNDGPEWIRAHYRSQIRTFWWALLFFFIAIVLAIFVIGFFLIFAVYIWILFKCISGIKALQERQSP